MKKLMILVLLIIFSSNLSFSEELKWNNGNIREENVYDKASDTLVETSYYREDGTLEKIVKYNMREQVIEIAYMTKKGKHRNGPDGWAVLRNQYDQNGKLIFEAYYDDGGNLIENKGYNNEDDLVYKEYGTDSNPEPQEEFNPEPTVAGETVVYD